jgi:dolichyl-phosphate mannosyltransferase polypeptide 2 regulatory subunit
LTYFVLVLQPFFDESSSLQNFFPPHQWSIYLPASILFTALSLITAFFLKTTTKNKNTQKAK